MTEDLSVHYQTGTSLNSDLKIYVPLQLEANPTHNEICATVVEMWLKRYCKSPWHLAVFENKHSYKPIVGFEITFSDPKEMMFFKLSSVFTDLYIGKPLNLLSFIN